MADHIEVSVLRRLGSHPIRLEWFGNVVRSTRTGQPRTDVCVVYSNHFDASSLQSMRPADRTLHSVQVPVAWLRLLRLGDIWEAGRRVATDPMERITFDQLMVTAETAEVIPCGLPKPKQPNPQRHDLPFRLFNAHAGHTKSYMVRVQVEPNVVLLVPSMEIVRFYFGSSGILLGNMFSGAFAGESLHRAARINHATGVANVVLHKDVPAMAAPTVARIAFNSVAARSFRGIINTGVVSAASGTAWYPRVGFPFWGATDLTAEGVWLDNEGDRVFVAHRLISCTHPFPFKRLYYQSDRDSFSGGKSTRDKQAGQGKESNADVELSDTGHDASRASRSVPFDCDEEFKRFPDLLHKSVSRVAAREGLNASGSSADESTAAQGLGLGVNRLGVPRLGDVTDRAKPLNDEHSEPECLRVLRELAGEVALVKSPLENVPASRVEVLAADESVVPVWISCFSFGMRSHPVARILLVAADGWATGDELHLLAVDVSNVAAIDRPLIAHFIRVFWAADALVGDAVNGDSVVGNWAASSRDLLDCKGVLDAMLAYASRGTSPEFEGADAA